MTDKILAAMALVGLFSFCGILLAFVPQLDLIIIVVVVLLMVTYDFWRDIFRPKKRD